MFKKYALLQWLWFWGAISLLSMLIESTWFADEHILGYVHIGIYFWAGCVVVLFAWLIKKGIKLIKRT